jgi:predicted Zn-dependent peptidase
MMRRMTRWLVCALVVAGAAARAEDAAPSEVPQIAFQKGALDNGLEILFHNDKRVPIVCVDVWYHVGAFNEDPGRTGFAHLFEHLMFEGTPHTGSKGHFKYLEAAGASSVNGTTNFDRTNYFECVPKNEAELALWLEADRMGYLGDTIDKSNLDRQRDVVKNERRQSLENRPYGLAEEKLWQTIFPPAHPYFGKVIGSMADLDKASLDDVRKFYDTYYAPSNATLAVAGDIEYADAQTLIAKYFKSLPKWPKPAKKTIPAPTIAHEVRVDFDDPVASVAKVEISYFTPSYFAAGDADADVLAHIFGEGNESHLHQALVVDAQLASQVGARNDNLANTSVLTLWAVVKPGIDPETVVNAIQAQIDLLNDIPPEKDEVDRAVATISAKHVFDLENTLARAEMLQSYNHYVGEPGYLEKDLARYKAVTPDTLVAAAKQYLSKDHRAVLVAKPKAATTAAAATTTASAGGAK